MATILRVDGSQEPLTDLSLDALQRAVGGFIELVRTHDGRAMYVHEEGKLDGLPLNTKATLLYQYGEHDPIVGDTVLLILAETKTEEDEL